MEVLRRNKVMWRMCGIYLEDDASFASHLCTYLTNASIAFTVASHVAMSAAFIVYADVVLQIEQIMYALLQCASSSAILSVYLTLLPGKRDAVNFTNAIQTLVNRRGYAWRRSGTEIHGFIYFAGYRFNRTLYESSERYANLLAKWPPILSSATFLMSLTLAAIGYLAHDLYVGAFDVSRWYKLYVMQTPYDRQTIRGYVISYIHESVTVICLTVNIAINLSIFIAPIFYVEAFCVDLLENFTHLDKLKIRISRSDEQSTATAQLIGDCVEFHNAIIE